MSIIQIITIDSAMMLALQWLLHRAHIVFQHLTNPALLQKKHKSSRTLAQSDSVIFHFHIATISQLEPHL